MRFWPNAKLEKKSLSLFSPNFSSKILNAILFVSFARWKTIPEKISHTKTYTGRRSVYACETNSCLTSSHVHEYSTKSVEKELILWPVSVRRKTEQTQWLLNVSTQTPTNAPTDTLHCCWKLENESIRCRGLLLARFTDGAAVSFSVFRRASPLLRATIKNLYKSRNSSVRVCWLDDCTK